MNVNEPTRPETTPTDKRILPSPVTFSPISEGSNRASPVTLRHTQPGGPPPSMEEVVEVLQADRSSFTTSAAPLIVVEDSFFDVEINFILKMNHRDLAKESRVFIRNDEGSRGLSATVVNCWQLVAGDLNDEKSQALGYENFDALAADRGWEGDEWETQPVTVIQIER